jgi:agmatinase
MSSFSIKNALVLGLALSTSVLAHSHHDHEHEEEIVLTDSKKEELLLKWEQEVRITSLDPVYMH